MFNRTAKIIAPIALAVGLITGGASIAYAAPGDLYGICTNNGGEYQCVNNWNGVTAPGNYQKFYAWNNGTVNNNRWAAHIAGYVTSNNPFTDGSGMNTRYQGRPVYQFLWGPNPAVCLDNSTYDAITLNGPATIQDCLNYTGQWFVASAAGYLVPVYATNVQFLYDGNGSHLPVFLGNDGSVNNGAQVAISPITYNNWALLVVP